MNEQVINLIHRFLFAENKNENSKFQELNEIFQQTNLTNQELKSLAKNIEDVVIKSNFTNNKAICLRLLKINHLLLNYAIKQKHTSEVYFSPGDDCAEAIVTELLSAKEKIDICVFTISDNVISREIIKAHQKGIQIRIITDDQKVNDKGSDINEMARQGIQVKVDNSKHFMHDKFAVFDTNAMLTGSFNWTRSASKYNQENIILSRNPALIKAFQAEFTSLWNKFPNLNRDFFNK